MSTFTMPRSPRSAREVITSLPRFVAVDAEYLHLDTRFVVIEVGSPGYSPLHWVTDLDRADAVAIRWGAERVPTEIEREAALAGSMFGWDAPGADPLNYR